MFVAVVMMKKYQNAGAVSGRPHGDWSCFVAQTKRAAIDKALAAKNMWEDKGYGPYTLLVGELTEEVTPSVQYRTHKLVTSSKRDRKKRKRLSEVEA